MELKDVIVAKVNKNKYGELIFSFKAKIEDYTPDQENALRNYWLDGTLLTIEVTPDATLSV